MLDLATTEGKIVSAALRLAAERPWQDVTLREIATAAGLPLAELGEKFDSKSAILKDFVAMTDKEVLAKAPAPREGETKRDALFEVLMARFDVLEPYKSALRSIADASEADISLILPILKSQSWMLEAAGIASDGPAGSLKAAGLATVYAAVFRTWLEDDDPGMARTMAVLDRRLRRGEQAISGIEAVFGAAHKMKSMLKSGLTRPRRTTDSSADHNSDDATPVEPAAT